MVAMLPHRRVEGRDGGGQVGELRDRAVGVGRRLADPQLVGKR
jgi:hypothetical protein